ncbi:MAG: TRAP transporter substrate-binding protein [Pseudomonadota bacterium]
MTTPTRRTLLVAGLAGAGSVASPAVLRARASPLAWKMVTSWPKNLPGPGMTASRLARRIEVLSAGRITVAVYAAGELTPALGVFDAVGEGTAELGHTASLFWGGKAPLAPFFTAAPFGLTPLEHMTWISHGGGQTHWDALYAPFGIKPFMAGNTGFQMGGWFRERVTSLDDISGLKMRMPGLGGEVLSRLGATTVSVPPGEILPALQSGLIDAAEFLGPWSDRALGLSDVAPYYAWPGFHEPNGSSECLVSIDAWNSIDDGLRAVIGNACAAENAFSLAESEWNNAHALRELVTAGVTLFPYPADVLRAARQAAEGLYDELAAESRAARDLIASYRTARESLSFWARKTSAALDAARAG